VKIPVYLPNFGGTTAALKFFDTFSDELTRINIYQGLKESILRLIFTESSGTHISNYDLRHFQNYANIDDQLKYIDWMVRQTIHAFSQFFWLNVGPDCDICGISRPRTPEIRMRPRLNSDNVVTRQ
jgi:hypothetical protein